jgi:lipopolysaccharide export LptBFGC system permease protein LptF
MMQDKIYEIRADMTLTRMRSIEVATERAEDTFRLLDPDHRHRLFHPTAVDSAEAPGTATPRPRPAGGLRAAGGSARSAPVEGRNEYVTRTEIETQVNKRESFVRQVNRYRVEIHKKFSIPFACVIFVLVGSPLAIRMGRSGMNMAIGLSILFFLVYYVCLIGGEKLADRGIVSPVAAMWSPNIFFFVLAVVLLRKAAREQSVSRWTIRTVLSRLFRPHATANPR